MNKLGFSGSIASRFQSTQITPLLALVGLLLGVFAVLVTPREEEPQINVTFANVFIPFPGASAREVESLVASPAEQVLDEIEGIEHVYSTSMPGMAVLTVQYLVGEDRTDAIVRLYSKIMSNQDWLPAGVGVGQPIIKPKGIDDVPIVTVTLWSQTRRKVRLSWARSRMRSSLNSSAYPERGISIPSVPSIMWLPWNSIRRRWPRTASIRAICAKRCRRPM